MHDGQTRIDKLDFNADDSSRPLLSAQHEDEGARSHSRNSSGAGAGGHFFEHVAQRIQEQDNKKFTRSVKRYVAFTWAIVNCLCAGSITAYSLYGHLFQSRLRYTQYQVNIVSVAAELGLYLPVCLFGLLCDRRGPGLSSFLSAILFSLGYFLAAGVYQSGPPPSRGGDGWPFGVMVFSFVLIGNGTAAMYLSAVATCAKNFGRGKHKGFALAAPIAAFGLGGMWQSQVGSRILYETKPDGSRGDVDVYRYFLFLGGLLLGCGLVGSLLLRVVDEEEMIDEAVEELEQSGLLDESEFFPRTPHRDYGTNPLEQQLSAEEQRELREEEQRKKSWLLNSETKRFLSDQTMWWLAAGFFLVTGPGEAFINNLGTIIGTLYPSPNSESSGGFKITTPATHVSIVAITSTAARILSGIITDTFAITTLRHQYRRGPHSLSSSLASLDPLTASGQLPQRRGYFNFALSRVHLLLAATLLSSLGQVLLASGVIQNHASEGFWAVSALIGTGYGAVFSLVPIIISCVWGLENFGTNWGIVAMVPALGAALWGAVYAAVYEAGTDDADQTLDDRLCYGVQCYGITFWAMAVSAWLACVLFVMAWRGPGGWWRNGIAV